jgi:hypothetical protein
VALAFDSIHLICFVSFPFVSLPSSTLRLSSHLDSLRHSSSNKQRVHRKQPIGNGDRIDEERQIGKVIESMTNKKSK